jgi:hypothetical protein
MQVIFFDDLGFGWVVDGRTINMVETRSVTQELLGGIASGKQTDMKWISLFEGKDDKL